MCLFTQMRAYQMLLVAMIWVQKRWRHTLKNGAESGFVNIVGGCCGTTPEHIKAFADAMQGIAPRKLPEIKTAMRLSGLEPLNIDDEAYS